MGGGRGGEGVPLEGGRVHLQLMRVDLGAVQLVHLCVSQGRGAVGVLKEIQGLLIIYVWDSHAAPCPSQNSSRKGKAGAMQGLDGRAEARGEGSDFCKT